MKVEHAEELTRFAQRHADLVQARADEDRVGHDTLVSQIVAHNTAVLAQVTEQWQANARLVEAKARVEIDALGEKLAMQERIHRLEIQVAH